MPHTPTTTTPLEDVLKAVEACGHPLRLRILLDVHAAGQTSPNQVAQRLNAPLNLVAYHVRIMRTGRLLELRRRGQVRGAIEHFYGLSEAGAELAGFLARLEEAPDA